MVMYLGEEPCGSCNVSSPAIKGLYGNRQDHLEMFIESSADLETLGHHITIFITKREQTQCYLTWEHWILL